MLVLALKFSRRPDLTAPKETWAGTTRGRPRWERHGRICLYQGAVPPENGTESAARTAGTRPQAESPFAASKQASMPSDQRGSLWLGMSQAVDSLERR